MSFKALLAKTKATKAFDKAKTVKDESVPDGTYHVNLTEYDFGTSQNGTPRAVFKWRCTRGECKGRILNQVFTFTEFSGKNQKGEKFTISVQDKYEQMFRELQRAGIETDCDPDEIEEQLDELIEDKTTVVVTASTKKDFQNIKINNVIKSETADDDEPFDEEDEEEDEDDDSDEEDDVEEDDDDDDDDWEPEKGEEVGYKLGGKRATQWTISSVNRAKKTVTIKREKDGRVEKNISWDDLLV